MTFSEFRGDFENLAPKNKACNSQQLPTCDMASKLQRKATVSLLRSGNNSPITPKTPTTSEAGGLQRKDSLGRMLERKWTIETRGRAGSSVTAAAAAAAAQVELDREHTDAELEEIARLEEEV